MGLCILIIPVAQILLKLGSKKEDGLLSRFLRPYLLLGFFLLFIVSILSVYSFQEVPLKTSAAWSSLSFVLVALSSKFLLKEPFPITRWLGCFLIFVGIFVFHL
jgi:drug/metabolite transporter (DMT)-like permease